MRVVELDEKEVNIFIKYVKVLKEHHKDIRNRVKTLEKSDKENHETIIRLQNENTKLKEENNTIIKRLDELEKFSFKLIEHEAAPI